MPMTSQELFAKRLGAIADKEKEASETYHQRVSAASTQYAKRRALLDKQRKNLERRKNDPVVFVKSSYGPKALVFHASKDCGWMPQYTEELLLGEAKGRGLARCSSWYCRDRSAEADAA